MPTPGRREARRRRLPSATPRRRGTPPPGVGTRRRSRATSESASDSLSIGAWMSQNASPKMRAVLVWMVAARLSSQPSRSSTTPGQAVDIAIEVVDDPRQAFDGIATAGLEHVLHRDGDQPVVTDVVAEDGPGAHARQVRDLLDRGVETAPGDDVHGRLPDARPGQLLRCFGQSGPRSPLGLHHRRRFRGTVRCGWNKVEKAQSARDLRLVSPRSSGLGLSVPLTVSMRRYR